MIFFFGTRASKIKERRLKKTTCPYCTTQDSFVVSTFGKYFHLFWIPIIPLFKTHVAECSHCKKSYAQAQFTTEMQHSLDVENRTDPVKRPFWHGCGCLVLVVLFTIFFSLSLYGVYLRSTGEDTTKVESDVRTALLKDDIDQLTKVLTREKDSTAFALKECVDYDIVSGLDTKDIEYFTKINNKKILVLLRIKNIKQIKPEFRKDILEVIEDCLYQIDENKNFDDVYIGIEGKWNTVLVKTPTDEDVGGRFADKNKLLSFYGEKQSDSLENSTE